MTPDLLDFIGPTGYVDDAAIAQFRGGGAGGSDLQAWYGMVVLVLDSRPRHDRAVSRLFSRSPSRALPPDCFRAVTNVVVWFGHLSYIARGFVLSYGVDAMLSMLLFCLVWGPTGGAYSLDRVLERYWRRNEGCPPSRRRPRRGRRTCRFA